MIYDFQTLVDRRGTNASKWSVIDGRDGRTYPEVIPMSVADMEFKTAPEIVAGLTEVLNTQILGYSSIGDDYYNAVIKWMWDRHSFDVKKEWICTSQGVVPALYAAISALAEPGDGVIVMPPLYGPCLDAAGSSGAVRVSCPLKYTAARGWEMDMPLFKRLAARPENKFLIFCSPHNPVGRVWKESELRQLADICCANNITVISDEIHMDFTAVGVKHIPLATINPDIADRTVTCTAPTKTFNIAGLDVSNIIISNEKLRDKVREKLHGKLATLSREACRIAYESGGEWLRACNAIIRENSNYVTRYAKSNLPKLKIAAHEGTYLMWLDFRAYKIPHAELKERLQKNLVFLTDGLFFGQEGEGFMRINVACPTSAVIQAMERIKAAMQEVPQ